MIGSSLSRLGWRVREFWRSVFLKTFVPVFRPLIWHVVFNDLMKRPLQLAYIKARIDLLDKYEQMFPDAKECSSPYEVLDIAIREALASGIRGLWLEFGVWRGETIDFIAKRSRQRVYGFDSFEGLPRDWQQGPSASSTIPARHFSMPVLPRVRRNVELVKGWFHETLPAFLAANEEKAAFIHVDSDLYESAKTVLTQLRQRIVPGTVILFDEYFNYPGWEQGEFKALTEFAEEHDVKYRFLAFNSFGEQVAIRIV